MCWQQLQCVGPNPWGTCHDTGWRFSHVTLSLRAEVAIILVGTRPRPVRAIHRYSSTYFLCPTWRLTAAFRVYTARPAR